MGSFSRCRCNAQTIIHHLANCETPSRNSHIRTLFAILRDKLHADWSYEDIDAVFEANKGTAHLVRSKAMTDIEQDMKDLPYCSLLKKPASPFTLPTVSTAVPQSPRSKSAAMSLKRLENEFPHFGHSGSSNVVGEHSNSLWPIHKRISA
jgi:hypothetical protein